MNRKRAIRNMAMHVILLSASIVLSTMATVTVAVAEQQQRNKPEPATELSTTLTFPSVNNTHQYLTLSHFIYHFNGDTDETPLPGEDLKLHLFEDYSVSGCVMVVSSHSQKYVAAVFRGTDSTNDWINDLQANKVPFGPDGDPIHGVDVLVHKGFNKELFNTGKHEDCQFDRVLNVIKNITSVYPDYQIITTGHSLGGALSILMAAGLADLLVSSKIHDSPRNDDHAHSTTSISAITFAAPLTGDPIFKEYVDSMSHLGVWNHVLLNDIVPHVPYEKWNYTHPGHTVWFQKEAAMAYYLHVGDESFGFAGVPKEWKKTPYSIDEHRIPN